MVKMRRTFQNIGREIAGKREMEKVRENRRKRGFRLLKIGLSLLGMVIIAFIVGVNLIGKKRPPVSSVRSKWLELKPGSEEYTSVTRLVTEITETMQGQGPDGLVKLWSRRMPPEHFSDCKDTMRMYKGAGLNIQSIRKKTDAPGKFRVICKSSANGHRLKISFRLEDGAFRLTGADMVP
ncbi:MAG: hypothetical protein PHH77_04965 [Victivallaceae bacterium]|nr:hypothetical protein [Victivallaceae bacterium]